MKKRFGVAAIVAATGCAVIFSGCAGCGKSGKTNEAAFRSNWYADTSFPYIQPTFVTSDGANFTGREEITYKVTLDTENSGNTVYSIEYGEGTYTTLFYATEFDIDKSPICDEFKGAYPESLTVYYYRTELHFDSVKYTYKANGKELDFDDGEDVITECYFTDVSNHLRPLYSSMVVNNHSPADFQPGNIESTYKHVNQEITTCYNYACTEAKTTVHDLVDDKNSTEYTYGELGSTQNSLIDVCGLNIALRAMQLSTSMTQTVSVYSPSGKMQDFVFSGSSLALSDDERKAAETVLGAENVKLFVPGEDKSLSTVCVTATLNENMSGGSQRYWFTAIDNLKNNAGRATMVKMTVPAPFSLGTFNYELDEIISTLYNG